MKCPAQWFESSGEGANLRVWRKAPDKVGELHSVLVVCGEDMKRQGVDHWDRPHPLKSLPKDAQEALH